MTVPKNDKPGTGELNSIADFLTTTMLMYLVKDAIINMMIVTFIMFKKFSILIIFVKVAMIILSSS